MKKLHSLFILSILALTMFVGCQMPTDGTGNGAEAVETESKVNEYGFISSETYTVVFTNGSSTTMTGEALTNAAKDTGMVNGTDYTINDKTVTLTASGMTKMTSYLENGGSSNGGGNTPMTYTLVGEEDSAAKYVLANLPTTDNPSKYAKGDTVTFSIKTKTGETPTELYLVKVTIKKRYTGDVLNIPVTVTKDHTVSFKMPDNDVMVRADFEDVVCRPFDFNSDVSQRPNRLDVDYIGKDSFRVALRFDNKEYDNLEPFGEGKFIYEFYNLESARVGSRWYFYIQLGKDYNVYDYKNPKNCKYHETPVVIYNDTMYEPVIGSNLGNRYVNLDAELNQN